MEAAKALGKGKDANSDDFKIQAVAGAPPKAARHARSQASQVPTAFSDGALPGQLPTVVEEDKADSQQAQQLQGADSIEPKTSEAALTPAQAAGSAGAAGSQDASGAAPASAPAQQPKKATFVVSDFTPTCLPTPSQRCSRHGLQRMTHCACTGCSLPFGCLSVPCH